ncbi:hypothetical protein NL676_030662 [Syzygium grande]|nr:hypothetical protein NL676_030662 [Syzygium grande]
MTDGWGGKFAQQKASYNSHKFVRGAHTKREREIDAGLGTAARRTSRTAGPCGCLGFCRDGICRPRILMFLLPVLLPHLGELLRTSFRWASEWASWWAAFFLTGPFTPCDNLVYYLLARL